jgi:hypothetical protein
VLTLSAAPASAGVTRVVSPSSSRTTDPCTTDMPCRLDYAMGRSVSRDDVSLLPGDYYDSGTTPWSVLPRLPAYTSIHGTVGEPLPVLHGHLIENGSFLKLDGATARDLAVVMDTSGIYLTVSGLHLVNNAAAERVQVHVTSAAIDSVVTPCRMENTGTLLDSICIGDGTQGYVSALNVDSTSGSSAGDVRNVTAVSTARAGIGIRVQTSTGNSALNATNVIARGDGADIDLAAYYGAGTARLAIDHSNWRAIRDTGVGTHELQLGLGNQTEWAAATPLFVDAAAGDYRQAPGSPTIDAGAIAGNSPFDFAGDPRAIGAGLDIGADEFFPPPLATTDPATAVAEHAATLNGTVTPMGDSATVRFEYGSTAAYGFTAAAPDLAAAETDAPVTATLAGLSPATIYHYRLLATTTRGGTATGADRTFRTAAFPDADAGGGPGPDLGPDAAISALSIGKRWRLGSRPPHAKRSRKAPVGTTIGFTLSKDAKVTLEFSRLLTGRRVGRTCRPLIRANRRKPRCTIAKIRGRFAVDAHAGRNTVRFLGRLPLGITLRPGKYRLSVRAGDASTAEGVRFTIVR